VNDLAACGDVMLLQHAHPAGESVNGDTGHAGDQ